ncbi:hypothetical protein QBC34DRAFT_224150 [Podospora aff. communis PSN243]|uniref:C2H2-type domain-containing protein n=1 Tax=Podospora aff. communis PSN243 TaxID=3040156 RepID=A0AAV9G1X4_9PEZI|nr:hypothetical protein QBC34DRAFT_224150 [Podospora aff. communis PSN243]
MDYQTPVPAGTGLQGEHPGSALTQPTPDHVSATSELPMRLTPITGRVSRANKGVPLHVCDICKPAKTFTRAEHLRLHPRARIQAAKGPSTDLICLHDTSRGTIRPRVIKWPRSHGTRKARQPLVRRPQPPLNLTAG